jgi:signal peptidase I
MLKTKLHKNKKGTTDFLHVLSKKIAYRKDVLNKAQLEEAESVLKDTTALHKDKSISTQEYHQQLTDLQLRAGKIFRPEASDSTREWVEVFLVAAVIAISFKSFFLQPFKIPTNSMYPSLYGVVPVTLDDEVRPPGLPARIVDLIIKGKVHHRIEIEADGTILGIRQSKLWGIPFIDTTEIRVDDRTYRACTSYGHFLAGTRRSVQTGMQVSAGDVLANFTTETGDHLFVNKMSYHFRKPRQGEVFVFTTNGIYGIEAKNRREGIHSGQFYIKRCVGVPGVTLKLQEPRLLSDGEILDSRPVFEKIYSKLNGYHGYTYGQNYLTGPDAILPLEKDRYWAMGDNSPNSLDSRSWGTVPRSNLVGTGLVVYWPFTSRWGLIK